MRAILANLRFAMRGENQAIARARGLAGLDAIDAVRPEKLVRVAQQVTLLLIAAAEGNLSLLLRNIKTEGRLVHRVTRQAREVGRRRIRHGALTGIDAVRINKTGPIHPERFGENIHL